MAIDQSQTTRDLPPIDDPIELLSLLRAGDRLHHCHGLGWRLVRGDVAVTEAAIQVLRNPFWLVGPNNEPFDFGGGRLAPMGDGLFPARWSQTWTWAEGKSNARH